MAQTSQKNGSSTYLLGRDVVSSARLNLQHYYWRESLGYTLHPEIPVDKPDLAIADVATGTGIWILDLASSLPSSTKLVGLDISAGQFPHPSWTPQNVQLVVDDASTGMPAEELRGAFDVVHVRLIMLMISNNDPSSYIQYCLALLKPGGYLQWEEYENYSSTIGRASSDASDEHLSKMLFKFAELDSFRWIQDLPTHFIKERLDVRSIEKHVTPDHHLRGLNDTLCIGQLELADVHKAAGNTERESEVRDGLAKAMDEIEKGTYLRLSLQVVVGQKLVKEGDKRFSSLAENLKRYQ